MLLFILPNLAAYEMASLFGLSRPLFDLGYAAPAVLVIFTGPVTALVVSLFVALVDALSWFVQIYGFNFEKAIVSVPHLALLDASFTISRLALLIGLSALIAVIPLLVQRRWRPAAARRLMCATGLVGSVLLVRLADVARQAVVVSTQEPGAHPLDIAAASMVPFARAVSRRVLARSSTAPVFLRSGISDRVDRVPPGQDIVLVLVESFGLFRSPQLTAGMLAPFRDSAITARYVVSFDTVSYSGSTTNGELRTLCDEAMDFGDLTKAIASRCLPKRLAARGYSVDAYHGYSARMFERSAWYPSLGLGRMHFAEELSGRGLGQCGSALRGICDDEMARALGESLAAPHSGPRFLYWLTLSSHLPVNQADARASDFECSAAPGLAENSDLCAQTRIVERTLRSVAVLADTLRRHPTTILLVGDHAPPFLDPRSRAAFVPGVVPLVALTPR